MPPVVINANKTVLFNDGEGLTHGDLNNVVDGGRSQAADFPHYQNIWPHAPFLADYAAKMDLGATLGEEQNLMAFTRGGGIAPAVSGAQITLGAGMIGAYRQDTAPASFLPGMLWVYIGKNAVQHTLPLAAAGQFRWHYITVEIIDTVGDTESRDFKDATTGNLSTITPNKRKIVRATFTVTSGASSATPTLNWSGVPAGDKYVYAVRTSDTAIDDVRDYTYPAGSVSTEIIVPAFARLGSAVTWEAQYSNGAIKAANATDKAVIPLGPSSGDPHARLIGIAIDAKLSATAVVKIGCAGGFKWTAATDDFTPLDTLSAVVDASGAFALTSLDFRGPNQGVTDFGPYWGGGVKGATGTPPSYYMRMKRTRAVDSPEMLALQFEAGASLDEIGRIQAYWARS